MFTIPKAYGYFELHDGTESTGHRVTLKTKIQCGKTARANGWDPEADASIYAAFMAWHSAKTAGATDLSWDDFQDAVVDAGVLEPDDEDQDAAERPTNPAH